VHIANKFEVLLNAYRRPDGRLWTGQEINEATGGVVTRSYVTNLRKGRIENPGYEKLAAIAKVMGFPPESWFKEAHDLGAMVQGEVTDNSWTLSDRVNYLFEVVRDKKTGKSYTNAEVARMSLGELTEEEVDGIRTGSDSNPSINEVIALAEAFGVHTSYFLDRGEMASILDQEVLDVFRDETVSAIARESLHLPNREKKTILAIVRQFENMRETEGDNAS
jgi:transcriptional regulator with XRE-family HTH domain